MCLTYTENSITMTVLSHLFIRIIEIEIIRIIILIKLNEYVRKKKKEKKLNTLQDERHRNHFD